MEFIDVPIEVDPGVLEQLAYATLQTAFPGFAPADGNLETIQIQAVSKIASVLGNLASAVPKSIVRFIGPLFGVNPIAATTASTTSTWTMVDTAGYTVPAGTLVGIRNPNGDLIPFQTLDDVIVPSGETVTAAGAVTIVAVSPGAAGSGLGSIGGPVELIDLLAAVATITQQTVTTGGVDAESDDDYLNRFAGEAQLLTPRPILPRDFAALLETIPGISRAVALDGYNPGVDELQTVTVAATGGTYKLTFSGQQTAAIAWNADAVAVQAALVALSNIAPGDVLVSGGPGGSNPLQVEFAGAYASTDVAAMTADATSLTGGAATATIATTRAGVAPSSGNARTVSVAAVDENGNQPSGAAMTAGQTLLASEREVNFLVFVIAAHYTEIDVAYTITIEDGFDPATVNTAAAATVTDFLSPAKWGLPTTGDVATWINETVVRYNDLAWVVKSVQGVRHVTALTFGVHGGALAGTDVTLTGAAPLPTVGTITGTTA